MAQKWGVGVPISLLSRCRFCKIPYVVWPTPVHVLRHCLSLELVRVAPHAAGFSDDPLLPSHRLALSGLEMHPAHVSLARPQSRELGPALLSRQAEQSKGGFSKFSMRA